MFSLCKTCGYTAEPQDIWCPVCSDLNVRPRVWVRMESVVQITPNQGCVALTFQGMCVSITTIKLNKKSQ